MEDYIFFHQDGRTTCKATADPSRPETWPFPREEITKVYLDCTKLFLSVPVAITNRHESEKLQELLDGIAVRYKEKWRIDFALEKMGMSKSRFSAFFRSRTGMSFVTYINKVRIEQARCLLFETYMTVESIGFDCGFDSPSHFYKYYGVSPARFREKN